MSRPYLFNTGDWHSLQRAQEQRLRNDIAALAPNRILTSSIEDLCDFFVKTFTLDVPVLEKDKTVVDQREKDIDVTHDYGRMWSTPGRILYEELKCHSQSPFPARPTSSKFARILSR